MTRLDLSPASWTIEAVGDVSNVPAVVRDRILPAVIPGCVHSDLIHSGIIGHPNIEFNEEMCQWIGRTDWRYRCRFDVDEAMLSHDRVDLVLDGLDTIAVIEINRQCTGGLQAMNMHHRHRFNVKPLLRAGDNELVLTMRGPIAYVEEQERLLGSRPVNGDWLPYSYMRKMASNFQWDWGPRVATCGIWRSARLETWSGGRIVHVRPRFAPRSDDGATLIVEIDVEVHEDAHGFQCRAVLTDGERPMSDSAQDARKPVGALGNVVRAGLQHRATVVFPVGEMARWWPRGLGARALHDLTIELVRNERVVDTKSIRVGLRETRLIQADDAHGRSFAIEVNGVPIFCKGANWIPEGLFPEDQSPHRIRQRVQQAADANFNMLRVWGGGTYEQDAFYEACDELGLMVWQDFMFACATYPEDDPYPQLIEREARETVSRLAHHPSIVLWCGGNENILGYESWGWKQRMPREQKWGERYYLEILPRVVSELDPSRPYWPDSPYSGSRDGHPNDPDRGDRHTWDAKVEEYRGIVPRFCSEFGHQSPPCWATMKEAWGEDQLRLDSRAMQHRQRATGGNEVWYGPKVMGGRFREPHPPDEFGEWLYLAHLLQARAISIGIEWLRANQPRCMGALFWQFNDAWAGHSWSCIDSAGRKKPLWHAVRRSFAPRLLTIQPFGGDQHLCAINETHEAWTAALRVRRMHVDGSILSEASIELSAVPRQAWRSAPLRSMVGPLGDDRQEFIMAESIAGDVDRASWFGQPDARLHLPPPRVAATCVRVDAAHVELTIRAATLVRDAVLAVDRVDSLAEIDDDLLTLLAGEERTLRIRTRLDVPAETWIMPPVFRCANEFTQSSRA